MQIHRLFARSFHFALIFSFAIGLFAVMQAIPAQAQTRVNDRDMEALMRNLRDDAKSFRPQFDKAVHKSTIRKTSQERDARNLAATFERQTNTLLDRFKKDRKAESEFNNVMASAEQLDSTVYSLSLEPQVTSQWEKIRTELHQIASAYGVPERFHHGDRDAMGTGSDQSCLQSAGESKANRLVNQCMQVSPATHPPCNAQNSCALIISEIKRGCAMLGQGTPGFCGDYR